MLSLDFFAGNREGLLSEHYSSWSKNMTVNLISAAGNYVTGCPKFPAVLSTPEDSDTNVGTECPEQDRSPSSETTSDCTWGGGRITMRLSNIMEAAGFTLNEQNPSFAEQIEAIQTQTSDSPAPNIFPYRLSGVTLLMNIEVANSCAGSKTPLNAGSQYDIINQFTPECLAEELEMGVPLTYSGPRRMTANITVTKIDDSGHLRQYLVPQPKGSSILEKVNGVKIIVQVNGNLYTNRELVEDVLTIGTYSPLVGQIVLLFVVFNLGLSCINNCVSFKCPDWCGCDCFWRCRAVVCCCPTSDDRVRWVSLKEETGIEADPNGMRYWTKENQKVTDQAVKLASSSNQLFRKLNPEPVWLTRNRHSKDMRWPEYGFHKVEGDLIDLRDAARCYTDLRKDHELVLQKDISNDNLEAVEDWLKDRGKAETPKIRQQAEKMYRRLTAKSEAIGLLMQAQQANQNLLRLTLIEMFRAMKPLVSRKMQEKEFSKSIEDHQTAVLG